MYRQITNRNARNQTLSATLGNGSMSQVSVYNTPTGQMKSHTVSAGSQIVDLGYDYDLYGNLSDADTTVNGITSTEAFDYDYLHRLQMSFRYTPSGNQTITYSYDAAGNITSKSDYATNYSYTGPGPNAVSSVSLVAGGSASFWYDGNGNMKTGHGKSMTYNAFNKPLTIKVGSTLVDAFSYGADLMRYRHQKNGGKVTWYLDKYMEIVTVGSTTDYRHYLGDVAILTKTGSLSDPNPEIEFVHRDRLGSAAVLTDEIGGNVRGRGFDPFGKPRNENWSDRNPPTLGRTETERGFTDHEHLDDAQLIHMNGRAYDYNLGRFLSVDPIIQAPGNSQSLNPYSYIMNNPLAGTDPSGYCGEIIGDGEVCTETRKQKISRPGSRIERTVKTTVTLARNGNRVLIALGNLASDEIASPAQTTGSAQGAPGASQIHQKVGKDIDDLVSRTSNMVVGRGPNGHALSDGVIKGVSRRAISKLKGARESGTGRGDPIAVAAIPAGDGIQITSPTTSTADGLVSLKDGAFGGTSAASAGAILIVVLLPDNADNSPVGRGFGGFVLRAQQASAVGNAGLPVILYGPRGNPSTGLMIEAINDSRSKWVATVDEVNIR